MFVVGRPRGDLQEEAGLIKEASLFQDLIIADFVDTYENLTLKTISALQWVSTYCPNAEFVLKVDSDMMINFENLIPYLETAPRDNFASGALKNTYPFRFYFIKWYISYKLGIKY